MITTKIDNLIEHALWANSVQRLCLLECDNDVDAALSAAEHIVDNHTPDTFAVPESNPQEPISAFFAHDIRNKRAQGILNRSTKATRELSSNAKRDLASAVKRSKTDGGASIVKFITQYRQDLTNLLTQTQLASVLEGARQVAAKVPVLDADQASLNRTLGKLEQPTFPVDKGPHSSYISSSATKLSLKGALTPLEYEILDQQARAKAIAVAGAETEATLSKIRDAYAEGIRTNADTKTLQQEVLQSVQKGTFMSDAHMDTVLRANVQASHSDGQIQVLSNPLVRERFPYVKYESFHDSRARHDHNLLDQNGINGTNVYRTDDPVFQTFRPPWDYGCRCSWTPLTASQAAQKGVTNPEFVQMPAFSPPEGFDRSLNTAPLSIQLSVQSMRMFDGYDSPKDIQPGPPFPTDQYPRNNANQFIPKSDIAKAAREEAYRTELLESIPQEERGKLEAAIIHLQTGGTVHHPSENPGLGVGLHGYIVDHRWDIYQRSLEERTNWEERNALREGQRKEASKAVRAMRRVEPDLDQSRDHLSRAGATNAELRTLSRSLHRSRRDGADINEVLDVFEDVAEAVFKRLEEVDPEPPIPIEPSALGTYFGMVGDEWHGPTPPGQGWVPTAPGPRGGKRWKRSGNRVVNNQQQPVESDQAQPALNEGADFSQAQFIAPERRGDSIHAAAVGKVELNGEQMFYKGVGKYSAEREMIVEKALSTVGVRTPKVTYAIVPGAPVETKTYKGEKGGIVSEWIDGKTVLELEDELGLSFTEDIEPKLRPGELDRIALMSYLLRMADRHEGNFMVSGDRLVSIDHEDTLWGEQGNTPIEDEDMGYELALNALCIRDSWDYKEGSDDPLDLEWSTPPEFNQEVLNEVANNVDTIASLMQEYNPNIAEKIRLQGSALKQMAREGNYSYDRLRQLDKLVQSGGINDGDITGTGSDDAQGTQGDSAEMEEAPGRPFDESLVGFGKGAGSPISSKIGGYVQPQIGGTPRPVSTEALVGLKDDVDKGFTKYANYFKKNGYNDAANWIESLRDHVNEIGAESALGGLYDELLDSTEEGGMIQYKSTGYFEEGEKGVKFINNYLENAGIIMQTGGAHIAGVKSIAASPGQSKPEDIKAGDFVGKETNIQDKLEESKLIPGLESSEDIHKLVGAPVTKFTPDVIKKLDKTYGKDKWVVKSYGDEAYAGFGVFFPQRLNEIQKGSRETLWYCNKQLKDYGYSLYRDDKGDVVGIKNDSKGTTHKFGMSDLKSVPKRVAKLAHIAAASAPQEKGAVLPSSPEDSIRQDYGIIIVKDDNGKVAGVTNDDGKYIPIGSREWKALIRWDSDHGHSVERAITAVNNGNTGDTRFMVQPAFKAVGVSSEDRARGATWETAVEGRVHVATSNGSGKVIPYATLASRYDAFPVIFHNDDTRAMEKAVQEAIDALPESERQGQVYAPDVIKTEDGWKVIELNATQVGGSSLWLEENPFVIDAFVSHVTGKDPSHAKFIRSVLKGEKPRIQKSIPSTDTTNVELHGKQPGGDQ